MVSRPLTPQANGSANAGRPSLLVGLGEGFGSGFVVVAATGRGVRVAERLTRGVRVALGVAVLVGVVEVREADGVAAVADVASPGVAGVPRGVAGRTRAGAFSILACVSPAGRSLASDWSAATTSTGFPSVIQKVAVPTAKAVTPAMTAARAGFPNRCRGVPRCRG
ncbi:hypothetical protein [Thermasporomyces composti]|uniref:hypothetical protein n=1 Tax=Thermasporomyces composti TaxID=696763 RepID=UPI001475C4F9|nr:hypothetical protein [Thermasporomyces composti]